MLFASFPGGQFLAVMATPQAPDCKYRLILSRRTDLLLFQGPAIERYYPYHLLYHSDEPAYIGEPFSSSNFLVVAAFVAAIVFSQELSHLKQLAMLLTVDRVLVFCPY